ncbi:MAG: hypothetical protein VX319_09285 [Bacteroidota bacterium]|nr:hypothetical protein [Bacteroidota bacterium]
MPQNNNQDIDVFDLFRGLKSQMKKLLIFGYRFVKFLLRNSLILVALIVLGAALGYGLSKLFNPLKTAEILVAPNVQSTSYLYGKIETLDRSISENEADFTGYFSAEKLKKIEIEPVEDITSVLKNLQAFPVDIVPRISESYDDESSFFEKPLYAPAYDLHKIVVVATDTIRAQGILDYLEANTFLQNKRKAAYKSIETEIQANRFSINQLDSILTVVPSAVAQDHRNLALLNSAENNEVSAIINSKTKLLERNAELVQQLESLDAVFKVYGVSNWVDKTSLRSLLMYIIPLVLVLIFIFYHLGLKIHTRLKDQH